VLKRQTSPFEAGCLTERAGPVRPTIALPETRVPECYGVNDCCAEFLATRYKHHFLSDDFSPRRLGRQDDTRFVSRFNRTGASRTSCSALANCPELSWVQYSTSEFHGRRQDPRQAVNAAVVGTCLQAPSDLPAIKAQALNYICRCGTIV
jgi:hypothetical protein